MREGEMNGKRLHGGKMRMFLYLFDCICETCVAVLNNGKLKHSRKHLTRGKSNGGVVFITICSDAYFA